MRTRLLMLGIILIFSLIPFPARPAWEEDSQPQFSPVPQYGDTTLEDLIIELEDPPMVEFKFPRIEGFQVSVAAMRHRLHRSRVQKNFQAQLFRFLDMADGNWKKDPDNLFRGTGFRRSLDLYRFFIILWSRLRLMDRADADFLVQKAKRALYEFEVETAVLQVRKTLSDSHSKLGEEDLKNLYWQAGYGQDRQGPKIKAEFFLAFNGIAVSVPSPLVEQIRELPYVKSVERDQTVQIAGDLDAAPQVDLLLL